MAQSEPNMTSPTKGRQTRFPGGTIHLGASVATTLRTRIERLEAVTKRTRSSLVSEALEAFLAIQEPLHNLTTPIDDNDASNVDVDTNS